MSSWDSGLEQPTSPLRRKVMIMAAVYSIGTAVCGAIAIVGLINIIQGNSGYIVMFLLFGGLALMTGYWMLHYLRDINAQPITVEGEVQRKWHKSNLLFFFMPSFYVRVERKIFSIPRNDYATLLETDLVRIHCLPHSLTVELVERYDETEKAFVPADDSLEAQLMRDQREARRRSQ